jgi:hypothetical protein
MSSENETKIELTLIKRVADDGGSCPDGADCPAQYRTNRGTRITIGKRVTDPEVLQMLAMAPGEVANETPESLHGEP